MIDPTRVAAMHAALGATDPVPGTGDALPAFWHWGHFWVIEPPDRLGRDGHPDHGAFMPAISLPRRMWAGGEVTFHRPIMIGEPATRVSEAAPLLKKTGRTGPLEFVTVHHRILQDDALSVEERQDLVFREDPVPGEEAPAPPRARTDDELTRSYSVTTTDLFRYSALTFNGHRIHYDLDYAVAIEGYPGLVVHGPLMALRLMELATDELGPLGQFRFRARAPVFHTEGFEACGRRTEAGMDLWIRVEDGRLAMDAEATFA